jgi:hypothetical protein
MNDPKIRRVLVIGTVIGITTGAAGARSWDPPLVGFGIILGAALAGTLLAIFLVGNRRDLRR